jgi:hypothetical protein
LLWLLAYSLNANALSWSFVRCEEPGGRLAIEFAGDHSQCSGRLAPVHGHDQAQTSSTGCDVCLACPCRDTPLGVAPAAPGDKHLRLARGAGAHPWPPAQPVVATANLVPPSIAPDRPAYRADRVTRRCLDSTRLLV